MTKQERLLYGKLIVDFANSPTTDEACFKFLENLQDILGLPATFIRKAKRAFPSLDIIKGKHERKTAQLIIDREDLRNAVKINPAPHKENLEIRNIIERGARDEVIEIIEDIDEIMEMGIVLKYSPTEEMKEINKWSKKHRDAVWFHTSISSTQQDLRDILKRIVRGERLENIRGFLWFLESYNERQRNRFVFTNKGFLKTVPKVREKDYFDTNKKHHGGVWLELYQDQLCYFVVEFFQIHAKSKVHT